MASRGLNKVMLIGRLGQDPEIRYLQNGAAVANFNLATSDVWKDKQTGEQKERTEWHRVVIFGKLAEIVGEYARKGSQVYVEGALQTRQWTDDSNITRYTTEVMVNVGGSVQLLGSKQNGTSGVNSPEWAEQSGRVAPSSTSQLPPEQQPEPVLDFDDDIPF